MLTVLARIAFGQLLVKLNSKSRFIIGIQVAVSHLWTTTENFLFQFTETEELLDTKVGTYQVQMELGCYP